MSLDGDRRPGAAECASPAAGLTPLCWMLSVPRELTFACDRLVREAGAQWPAHGDFLR